MSGRMSQQLVALCSVAIGSIYAAGYFITAVPTNAAVLSAPVPTTGSTAGSAPVAPAQSSGQAQSSSARTIQTAASSSQGKAKTPAKAKYRDGTFYGTGSSVYGTVAVALAVKQGRIASVQITQCTTHYPQSVIDPVLPQMVLSRQSWRVDIVSGATASTIDFAQAVYSALQQAKL
ncbi:FMN-binding protein [Alicyclobacillaceae bacterium I2511]|nr:FMN-binding protein [Alicyclobacillaceae bacterium I2511]